MEELIGELKDKNPGYTYSLFDDNDIQQFINENYSKDVQRAYSKLHIGAAKADFWRYLVLYKNGGVYIDFDSYPQCNLDQIIRDTDYAIITREGNPDYFAQWCLFFGKEHPVLKKTIEYAIENILNAKETEILKLTGPVVYTRAIKDHYSFIPFNNSIHDVPDDYINNLLVSEHHDNTRFFKTDYDNLVQFHHPHYSYLYEPYTNVKHWINE
jgi:mannosyltransferase OCH1-like enzyme